MTSILIENITIHGPVICIYMQMQTLVVSIRVWFNWMPPLFFCIVIIYRLLLDDDLAIVLYSLTKYSAIFAEVKEYFGIFVFNNQLVGMVWSCYRSLKCQHLLRADIEDGKLLLSSMRVHLNFALSLYLIWCNNKLGRSVGEVACSPTIQDQFWINNQQEVIIRISHVCPLKISRGPKLGNWKSMWQPCVDQILLKFTLVLLSESNNQLKDGWHFVFDDAVVLICHHSEGAAPLV